MYNKNRKKGFVRTVEAILAGLIIFAYLTFFTFKTPQIQGLEKEKYSSVENLLMVASTSNASYVLIHAPSKSSTRMLRDLLPNHEKIQFFLEGLPKKQIKIGIWINDSFVKKINATPCDCKPPLYGICDCFSFLGTAGVINNYTFIGIDENGDGIIEVNELNLPFQLINISNGIYAFGKMMVENNYVLLDVLNITPYYGIFVKIPSIYEINGKKFFLYKLPVYYGSILTPIDVLLFYNETYPINKYYSLLQNYSYSGGGLFLFANLTFSKTSYYLSKLFDILWNPRKINYLSSNSFAIISGNTTPNSPQYFFKKYFYSSPIIKYTMPVKDFNYSSLDVSKIPYAAEYGMLGMLVLNGERYPFILLNTTPNNYSELFVSFNHNYNFSDEIADYSPIYAGKTFKIGNITIQFEKCSKLGLKGCFYIFPPYHFHDVPTPTLNENNVFPLSDNINEYAVDFPNVIINVSNNSLYYAPLVILTDVSGVYRVGWCPLLNLSSDDNLHLLTTSLIWASREWNSNTGLEYRSKIYIPIIWANRTLLFGRGSLIVW